MTFESWLRKQKNRDDPIGDLASDFIRSLKIDPKLKTIEQSMSRWMACSDSMDALSEAKQEYAFLLCDVCSA